MNSLKLSNRKSFVATVIAISLLITFPLSTLLIREVAAQTTHEVKITDFAFVPQILTINPGDTVMWDNTDPVIHTLWFVYVANGSTYLLSDPILPDTTWTHTFNDVVELQYYSFDKLWITGFITVTTAEVHDVAVTNVTATPTAYHVNITVLNEGDSSETFNVTAYADSTRIGPNQTVTNLAPSAQTTLTFLWNASGWTKGTYTISGYAWPVLGETIPDQADNTKVDGTVQVIPLGDLGSGPPPTFFAFDGSVDSWDYALWKACFDGVAPPEAMYLGDLGTGPPPTFFAFDGSVDSWDYALWKACYDGLGPDP